MIPGKMELIRAPFVPHLADSSITRFSLHRLVSWHACRVSQMFSG